MIVIGDADRLVPQESSPEAANALLKLLEEPPADTLLVLTATDPTRVLPTIRSRAVVVRVGRLADAELEQGLAALLPELSPGARRERIQRAAGSLGRALDDSGTEAIDSQVIELLEAAKRGGVARFERALSQGPWAARGDFTALLDRLAEALGQAARARATGGDSGVPDVLATVNEPTRVLRALDRVAEAREAAQRNVNPQLLLATLTGDLAEALWA